MTLKRACTFSSFLALTLASGVASAAASKLLISEVVAAPTEAEMIGIANAGNAAVVLTDYYIADYNTYYSIATGTPVAPASADFLARFPAGASIPAGAKQWISLAGAVCFNNACGSFDGGTTWPGYGVDPTYEFVSTTSANNSATVPDMLAPFTGAIGSTRGLTNSGEPIVLFYWDPATNHVVDVDYVYFGAGTSSNAGVNKTGVSPYLAEVGDSATHHAPVTSGTIINTCRMDFTEGTQVQSGSNGVNGADETSENCETTFYACTTVTIGQDTDLDGVPNSVDNCPTQKGPPSNNGCPLTDGGTDGATGGTGGTTDAGTDAATGGTGGTTDAGTDAATGGTGGATDAGTDASSGGAAGAATGGAAGAATGGAAGAATGGAAGAATGGSGGATGGSGGAPIGGGGGTGGTKPGTGGTGGFKFDAGVGGAAGSSGSSDSGGCGCETVGSSSNAGLWTALSLLGVAFGLRRRQRSKR